MNFLHLKYFLLVAEELNITRAAERLFISQQSLSNHISNMEKELDVKLFTRSPKLSLTYAGDLLVETATQILDLHSQFLAKVGDINRHYMGVLRVGISHTCGLALLPEILPQFQAEFPMVEFSLFEGNSTHLEDELAHGRVDLIVCFQPIMMEVPKSFTDEIFGERAGEIREQFSSGADIDSFQHMPFILIKRGNRTRSTVDQYFSRHFFKPKLILETENTITTLAMAEAGIGITICPELFLKTIHVTSSRPPSASWWWATAGTGTCPTSASGSSSWRKMSWGLPRSSQPVHDPLLPHTASTAAAPLRGRLYYFPKKSVTIRAADSYTR